MLVGAAQGHALAGTTVLLALRLNGIDQPETIEVLRDDRGAPALTTDTWRELRLKGPAGAPTQRDGRTWRRLDEAPVTWRVDESTQTLEIDAPARAFVGGPMTLDAVGPTAAPSASRIGGYANYDLQWQRDSRSGAGAASGLIELGGFAPAGDLRTTALMRHDALDTGVTRLDTTWSVDDPQRMASLRIGDTVSQPGSWGRALRIGGLQWSTDFSLQPGFLSFPLPSMRGEAALPSTVELYVDNSRRMNGQVGAGAFDLRDLPVVTGQGELRVVVRDLLGREQVVVRPYYASPALLKPGLRASSFELGAIREDYGLASWHYGRAIASASDRLGVNETFTRELRAEAVAGRSAAAGAAGVWLLPAFGTVQLGGVASQGPDGAGALLSAGAERQARDWSGSLQWRQATPHFTQAGQVGAAPRTHLALALGRNFGGTGIGVTALHQAGRHGERQNLLALNASRDLGLLGTLSVVALRDVARGQTVISLSLFHALDDRRSVGATSTRRRDDLGRGAQDSLSWQQALPDGNGLGLQLAAERGDVERQTAQAQWQTDVAVVSAGVAHARGIEGARSSDDARLGVSGGVAWLGDSLFASRRIDGSFAVVEVGDYPGVQVLHEHRPVARTDANGRALVPGLRGHETNRIGIDANDLPLDADVEAVDALVMPPARSGVVVALPIRRVQAASFRLVDTDGRPVPVGSSVRTDEDDASRAFAVGYDGRTYVTGLAARNVLVARWPGHVCRTAVDMPARASGLPELGTLRCE